MALVCMKCYKIHWFNYDERKFPKCEGKGCKGHVAEIDELLIPVIIELNKKGYKTCFCCAGHYYEAIPQCYICFEKDMPLLLKPKFMEYSHHWKYNKDNKTWTEDKKSIYYKFDSQDEVELYKMIYNNALELQRWVKTLPVRKKKIKLLPF
jgi:hypothetical protein